MFYMKIVEEIKTHFMFNNVFFENRAFFEMWKNTVHPDRPQMAIWRTRIARWIPKATNTYSEYVIHIAFALQQWFPPKYTSMLCYAYIAYRVSHSCHKTTVREQWNREEAASRI